MTLSPVLHKLNTPDRPSYETYVLQNPHMHASHKHTSDLLLKQHRDVTQDVILTKPRLTYKAPPADISI